MACRTNAAPATLCAITPCHIPSLCNISRGNKYIRFFVAAAAAYEVPSSKRACPVNKINEKYASDIQRVCVCLSVCSAQC